MKLSVIVPIYNERLYLPEVFRRVCTANLAEYQMEGQLEVIAVDDGSTDGSREWLKELETEFPARYGSIGQLPCNLKTVFHGKNRGKGAAIRSGIEQSTGDIVLIQDSDLEYHPNDYPRLLAPILRNDADAVFGSRFLGTERRVLYFWHAVVNHFLTGLFNLLTDKTFTDIETGYKVMRGEVARSLRLTSSRFGIEPEIGARLAKAGVRLFEVGVSYRGRTYDEGKKIGPLDGIAALFHILRFTLFGGTPFKPGLRQTLTALQDASDRFYARPLAKALDRLPPEPRIRRVLEIGAGVGAVTRSLLRYPSVVASDIDADSVSYLNNRFSFVEGFHSVLWDATLPPSDPRTPAEISKGGFDLIVAFNVVEHLEDAPGALQAWSSLLNPNGVMVILVPSQLLFTPIDAAVGHFRRYTRSGLTELFHSTGGKVFQIRYVNPLGVAGWVLNGKILRRSHLSDGQVRIYNWIKPVVAPIERVLERFFGLSILAVGRWEAR